MKRKAKKHNASRRPVPVEQADSRLRPFKNRFIKSSMETAYIPAKGAFAWVGAAAYLAVLAYPEESEYANRDEFIEAAKALLFKSFRKLATYERQGACSRVEPGPKYGGANWRKQIGPEYLCFKNEHILGILRRAFRRIRSLRLTAAEIASWLATGGLGLGPFQTRNFPGNLRPTEFKSFFVELGTRGRMTLRDASRAMSDRIARQTRIHHDRESHSADIFRLKLRSSEPVLHLAMVLGSVMLERRGDKSPKDFFDSMFELLRDPKWLADALHRAEIFRCGFISTFYPEYKPQNAICLLPEAR